MRWCYLGGAAVGLLLLGEAVAVASSGPSSRWAWLGVFSYLWLLFCLVGLVVSLRRGLSPWFFVVFILYALADALYGFYLAAEIPDPSQFRLPPAVVFFHGFFGAAYAFWGVSIWRRFEGVAS